MPPVAPQLVQLSCPTCGTPFRTGIYTLVDVGEQPELKAALMAGQLNVAACPKCGTTSMLAAPLIYHDAAKQLCLVYFPQEFNTRPEDQERFVGEVTSFVIRSLPQEAPKAYLLNPRRFLSLPSLLDAILEADGVTREMIEAQRGRVDLISELATQMQDEEAFEALLAQRRADITPELIATLGAFIQATPPSQAESREMLIQLYERLVDVLQGGEGEEGDDEDADAETEAAIERLAAAGDDELEAAVAELRHIIDYSFFESLAERIEALEADGEAEAATALSQRRAAILAITERMDREAQALLEAGTQTLSEVINAQDLLGALRERADRLDEGFSLAVSANMAAAQRVGNQALAERLQAVGQATLQVLDERLTPEDRFINSLVAAETPQDATRLLRKSVAMIKPDLVKRLNELSDQAEKSGDKPSADRLRQMAREAGAMLF